MKKFEFLKFSLNYEFPTLTTLDFYIDGMSYFIFEI